MIANVQNEVGVCKIPHLTDFPKIAIAQSEFENEAHHNFSVYEVFLQGGVLAVDWRHRFLDTVSKYFVAVADHGSNKTSLHFFAAEPQ